MKAKLYNAYKPVITKHPVLLLCGDGRSLIHDTMMFHQMDMPHDTACIGRSIKLHEHCLHWFNADGETAIAWASQLKSESSNGLTTHTLGECDGFDVDWQIEQDDYNFRNITNQKGRLHGSSAMFATLASIHMGYEKIVLAGCPLDHNGHWYFNEDTPETLGPIWLGMDYAAWLDFANTQDASKVKSMSGYTQKILGKVTREWLKKK